MSSGRSEVRVDNIPDYQYEELKTPDEIRLITIAPGDFDEDIVLRVFHDCLKPPPPEPPRMSIRELEETLPPGWEIDETRDGRFFFIDSDNQAFWEHPDSAVDPSRYLPLNLGSKLKYEALSYTGGDLPDGGNSGLIPVYIQTLLSRSHSTENTRPEPPFARLLLTSNLASALRHLRLDKARTLPLWIDSISINQSSIPERNAQILRMTDIYRLAHQVIVWLGPSSSNSSTAVRSLSDLGKQFVAGRKLGLQGSPDNRDIPEGGVEMASPYNSNIWTAIEQLFDRPWFQRLWVVQEIQLARNAVVYCGMDKIPWDWLWRAANFILYNDYKPSSIVWKLGLVLDLGSKACGIRSSIETARVASGRLCADPRDSVYGLIGILPSNLRDRIQPHYGKEVWEVYRDFMTRHMDFVERLEMLGSGNLGRGPGGSENGCPSWVPDFSGGEWMFGQILRQFAAGYSRCWADSRGTAVIKGQRSSSILRVSGVQCGSVVRAETISIERRVGFQPVAEALWAFVSRKHEHESRDSYVTGESLARTIAKVVCLSWYKERCPKSDLPELKIWMQHLFPSGSRTGGVESNFKFSLDDYRQWGTFWHVLTGLLAEYMPCIVETGNGYVGFGPVDTQEGDIISVLLGCDSPILLRPNPDGDTSTVVGLVHAHGLDDTNALLGPLPEPWQVQVFKDRAGQPTIYRFYNPETDEVSDEDPRLDPLPDEWVRVKRDRTEDDPLIFQCFKNTITGETINHDPRMSPEALIARGVDIRTFCLV